MDNLTTLKLNNKLTVGEASTQSPLIFILVRHSGCTFCRQTIDELSPFIPQFKKMGLSPVLVHMGDEDTSELFRQDYNLGDIWIVSDPTMNFYRQLGARRGSLTEVLSPRVIWNGLSSGALKRHGLGLSESDVFQLGGVYWFFKNQMQVLHRPKDASHMADWKGILSKPPVKGFVND